jgi:predicted permease
MRSHEARVRGWRIAGQNQLVAMQVALSLAMLTIAAFSVQVFGQILEQGPGFRTAGIAKVSIDAGQAGYRGPEVVRLFERVVNQARRMPGVSSAAVTDAMPLFSLASEPIFPDGHDSPAAERPAQVFTNSVGEDYFTTLEIPILEGRPLLATDSAAAPPVAVINETFARRHWPQGGALGRRLRLGTQNGPAVEIVGVARNAKYLLVTEGPTAMVYFPFRQRPPGPMVLLTATDGESASLLSPLLQVIRGIDDDLPVYDVQTMERFYHTRSSSIGGVVLSLITSMSAMGVALMLVGLYALVSYAVVRRTREIGIRMAVGATYARVLQLLLRQGMMPAWVGLIIGLGLSLLLTRILPALASVGQAYDVRLFLMAVSLLLTVTLLAAFVPARRAALVNPTEALRHE